MSRPNLAPELLQWLYKVLTPEYSDTNKTYQDTAVALRDFPSLRPRTAVYTDETGRSDLLLCLHGIIPTVYNNNTYHIPVEIWVPKSYPLESPMIYVRPTESMVVNPSNYVDTNGRCFHPYITYWGQGPQPSSIVGLIHVFIDAFSRVPPVFAKPKFAATPNQHHPQRPPTIQNGSSDASLPSFSQSQEWTQATQASMHRANVASPPPLPSKPYTSLPRYSNVPSPSSNGASTAQEGYQGEYQGSQEGSQGRPPSAQYQQSPLNQQQPGYGYNSSYNGSYNSGHNSNNVYNNYESPRNSYHTLDSSRDSVVSRSASTVVPDIMDMESQPVDQGAAPAKPPNPEKSMALNELQHSLESYSKNAIEPAVRMDGLALVQTAKTLEWMDTAISKEMRYLETLQKDCTSNCEILKERKDAAQQVIREAKSKQIPNIDELVMAETVVHNQLYDLISSDRAIDDTLYVLDKMLDLENIKLDAFLKHTRALAREQFLKRALVNKIGAKIGIA